MITVPAFNFVLEYRNDVMITVSAKVWRIQVESCTMFMNEAPSSLTRWSNFTKLWRGVPYIWFVDKPTKRN